MRKVLKENNEYEIDINGNIYRLKTGNKLNTKTQHIRFNKTYRVKIVVANNLIPNPNNYTRVINIDGNKNNNHPSNLKWSETIYGKVIFNKRLDKKIRSKIKVISNYCSNKKSPNYKDYGAKGIKVCDEWNNNSIEFLRWSKTVNYKEGNWLYRYNKKEGFTPENCYWGEPYMFKLNCEMVEDIKNNFKDYNHKTVADKYNISSVRVGQLRSGRKLKNCN